MNTTPRQSLLKTYLTLFQTLFFSRWAGMEMSQRTKLKDTCKKIETLSISWAPERLCGRGSRSTYLQQCNNVSKKSKLVLCLNTINFGSIYNSYWVTLTNADGKKTGCLKTIQGGDMKAQTKAATMETERGYKFLT